MTIPQPPQGYGPPAQQPQYNAVQYQPPTTPAPQYGQQTPAQVMPATVPSENLPGWGQIMGGGGGKALPTQDPQGSWLTGVWQGGIVVAVDPPKQRTAPRDQGGKPLVFDDGQPKVSYPVSLLTQDIDPSDPNDRGVRKDYIQSTAIKAVCEELQKHGATQPEVGGVLYRCLVSPGGPNGTKGQRSHIWQYAYTPPTPETLALAAAHNAPPVQTGPPPAVAPPAPQVPALAPVPASSTPMMPPEYAAAGWTAEQYAAHVGQQAPPAPPAAPQYVEPAAPTFPGQVVPAAPGAPSAWPYAAPQAPAPAGPPAGVPAPPQFPVG